MTTNTPNQTLKFPFGETPEEVIGERLAATKGKTLRIEADRKIDVWMFTSSDHLLTVLENLRLTAQRTVTIPKLAAESRSLRIQILAALGIDEGGE